MGQLSGQAADAALMVRLLPLVITWPILRMLCCSSVIAVNLLSTDEILRAGRSSLKPEGQQ